MYLEVSNLKKSYGEGGSYAEVLKGVSVSVEKGVMCVIQGTSGSGKSTLLNCIGGLDLIDSGSIKVDGKEIFGISQKKLSDYRRENLGFIFQDFNLLDTLTLEENISLALTINKTPLEKIGPRVQEIAASLNITDILSKYPYQVSGGQKQRCACARALVCDPKLILADEPTGALDSHSSQMLLSTMQSINDRLGATILMVTHDAFSASYAGRILFLKDGEIFTEIHRGNDTRKTFYDKVLNVLTMLGGGQNDVF